MTIKNFSIEYDAVNSRNTFTNGDVINGRIIVEVSKETKVQDLIFIAKGKARVCWSENYGNHHHVYRSSEKYYEVKHHILREARQDGTEVVSPGRHVFPFTFTIPDRKIPSTFSHSIGRVVHKVKAELKQSMKLTKKTKAHFTFVSKTDMDTPGLLDPQYGCKDKSVQVFGSGKVSLDVRTQRMGYQQGEVVQVVAEINNCSSRSVKPKFTLYEKKSFFAQGRRRVYTKEILKDKLEAVASSGKETVTKVITIPRELPPSILNCAIIRLEYRLKIYLDIKCASDPEVKLPIVVMPASVKQPPPTTYGPNALRNPSPTPAPWGMQPPPQAASWGMQPPPQAASWDMQPPPQAASWGMTPPPQAASWDMQPPPQAASWGMTPPPQAAPRPVDPPPPYGEIAMYPPLNDKSKYEDAL